MVTGLYSYCRSAGLWLLMSTNFHNWRRNNGATLNTRRCGLHDRLTWVPPSEYLFITAQQTRLTVEISNDISNDTSPIIIGITALRISHNALFDCSLLNRYSDGGTPVKQSWRPQLLPDWSVTCLDRIFIRSVSVTDLPNSVTISRSSMVTNYSI